MMLRWFKRLFQAAAASTTPVVQSQATTVKAQTVVVQPGPQIQQEAIQKLIQAAVIDYKCQTQAAVRQSIEYSTSLARAEDDLLKTRLELRSAIQSINDFRILCFCKRLGNLCVDVRCRENGCIRKQIEDQICQPKSLQDLTKL